MAYAPATRATTEPPQAKSEATSEMITLEAVALVISTSAAALGTVFAGWQILRARNESTLRATFEHIREVVDHLRPLWRYDAATLQQGVLAFYQRQTDQLPESSADYLAFLEAVDLLALAIEKKTVNRNVAETYLKTLFRGNLIDAAFLDRFQQVTQDAEVYAHLRRMVAALQR